MNGARLSELAVCPRRCCLGAMGTPRPEPSERQKLLMDRGRHDQRWIYERFKAKYGPRSVRREVEVPWPEHDPIGVGHIDLYVPREKLVVEVKSTTAQDSMFESAIAQARMYLYFYRPAKRAAVLFLNPRDLTEETIPVVLRAEHVAEIAARVEEVRLALARSGPMPACTFSTPDGCRNSFCPYTDVAWEGWVAPEVYEDDPAFVDLARSLKAARTDYDLARQRSQDAERRWKELCAEAAELGLEPGRDYISADGIVIRRTLVQGRETFSLSKAKKAGVWESVDDERFSAFVSVSDPSERWSVKTDV